MFDRRSFLKIISSGVAGMGSYVRVAGSSIKATATNFGLHPFIEANPNAVFIMKTNIDPAASPPDAIGYFNQESGIGDIQPYGPEKINAGLLFSRSVFVPLEEGGMPTGNTNITIKPNWKGPGTTQGGRGGTPTPDEEYYGCSTDVYFTEGIIEGFKELGIPLSNLLVREAYRAERVTRLGWPAMATRTGIPPLKGGLGASVDLNNSYSRLTVGEDYNWHTTPNGIYFSRIPRHDPINMPGSFLLNISRFKAHGMGLTLCAKNLQGATSRTLQAYCNNNNSENLTYTQPKPSESIAANYAIHKSNGVPGWDVGGNMGGAYYESWVTRTLDNLQSMTVPQLHVIEGITGRDGDGGNGNYWGPHPVDAPWDTWGNYGVIEYTSGGTTYYGTSKTFLTNFILFGMNAFNVDAIGHWLGGHEPGRFGLFHIAKERGLMDTYNPQNINVYEWDEAGNATRVELEELVRTPLLTYYLWNRDPSSTYTATHEPYWRLLDEYDYPNDPVVSVRESYSRPEAIVLNQNRPNPFNPSTSIEFRIPKNGYVLLDIYNLWGQRVDVLADGNYHAGAHMVNWNVVDMASGTYFYRLRFGGTNLVKKMTLIK